MRFYFTFGDSKIYPFRGGWVVVHAPSLPLAIQAFRAVFPNKHDKILNCADCYTEAQFKETGMMETGNRGAFCHQEIHALSPEPSPIRVDVMRGLYLLGYHNMSDDRVSIRRLSGSNYCVSIDGRRFGIWDAQKRTFID